MVMKPMLHLINAIITILYALQVMNGKKSRKYDGTARVTNVETFEGHIHTRVRIQWMEKREKELLALICEAEPSKLDYLHQKTILWNRKFPVLCITEIALTRWLAIRDQKQSGRDH